MIPRSDRREVADLHVHEKYANIADLHVRGDVFIHEDADCHIHSALIEGALTLDAKQLWKAPPDKPLLADGIDCTSTARLQLGATRKRLASAPTFSWRHVFRFAREYRAWQASFTKEESREP